MFDKDLFGGKKVARSKCQESGMFARYGLVAMRVNDIWNDLIPDTASICRMQLFHSLYLVLRNRVQRMGGILNGPY